MEPGGNPSPPEFYKILQVFFVVITPKAGSDHREAFIFPFALIGNMGR